MFRDKRLHGVEDGVRSTFCQAIVDIHVIVLHQHHDLLLTPQAGLPTLI